MVHEIALKISNSIALQVLLVKAWSSVLIYSGVTGTVCGSAWFCEYLISLPGNEKLKKPYNKTQRDHPVL